MKIELITWRDGTWGVRQRLLFGYRYRGIGGYWWSRPDHVLSYCRLTEDIARSIHDSLTDKGTPVGAKP